MLSIMGPPPVLPGRKVNDVFQVLLDCRDGHPMMNRIRDNQEFLLLGASLKPGKYTIYEGMIENHQGKLAILISPQSEWFAHEGDAGELAQHTLELCAGFGGMGQGARFLGLKQAACIDWTALSTQHLGRNTEAPILQLDITSPEAPRYIHRSCGTKVHVALLGFPCQPYSRQGFQRGELDSRAEVLPKALKVIYLLQSQAIVLECVTGAKNNQVVHAYINEIAKGLDLQIEDVELELARQWPMKRHRWWVLMTPKTWNNTPIPTWPKTQKWNTIGDIIDGWHRWPLEQEQSLWLTQEECDKYNDIKYGNEVRELGPNMVAATLLHRYGNALSKCPCECRQASFSESSLTQRGLRGYYVRCTEDDPPRFLHPREAMLLVGAQQNVHLSEQPRDDLALIGLIASPMQSIWLCIHLRNAHSRSRGLPLLDPIQVLGNYQHDILLEAHMIGIPIKQYTATLEGASKQVISFRCVGDDPCYQTEQAMRAFTDWGSLCKIELRHQTADKRLLVLSEKTNAKRSRKELPHGTVEVELSLNGRSTKQEITAGQFAFELLRQAGYSRVNKVQDHEGNVVMADFRIWQDTKLHLLDLDGCTALRLTSDKQIVGGGPIYVDEGIQTLGRGGLSEIELQYVAEAMLREANQPTSKLWTTRLILRLGETLTGSAYQIIRELLQHEPEAFGFFWDDHHWVLMHVIWSSGELLTAFYDGFFDSPTDDMQTFAERIATAVEATSHKITYNKVVPQTGGTHCGTVALLHLGLLLGLEVEATEANAERWYQALRTELRASTQTTSPTITWQLTGSGPEDAHIALSRLLLEKGVPKEKIDQRAHEVQVALGNTLVNQALRARNQWAALKEAANKPGIRMRLLTQEEQENYIQERAQTKHGAKISSKKKSTQRKQNAEQALTLDPELLKITPEHFQDENGKSIMQIAFNEVEAGGRGLAICNIGMAQQFLEKPKKISQDALGLLLTEAPPDEVSTRIGIAFRLHTSAPRSRYSSWEGYCSWET